MNQLELEQENLGLMIEKQQSTLEEFKSTNRVSDFHMSNKIIPWYTGELSEQLYAYKEQVMQGTAKRKAISAKVLSVLAPEIIAHYTVKCVVDSFGGKEISVLPVARKIAEFLKVEYQLQQGDQKVVGKIQGILKNNMYHGKRKAKVATDLLYKYDETIKKNLDTNFTKVALVAISVLSECQPIINDKIMPILFVMDRIGNNKDTNKTALMPMPWFMDWIQEKLSNGELIPAYNTPMIEPPKPWKSLRGGGYYSERFKYDFIRTDVGHDKYLGADLSNTMRAVNRIQETKWRINKRVLEVMQYAKDKNKRWGDLPYNMTVYKTPYPFPETAYKDLNEAQKDEVKRWRKQATAQYDEKVVEDSKYMTLVRVLGEANRFKDFEAIYFPHFVDFRGRIYPKCSNLHPQGTDFTKALLEFSEGKPIDSLDAEMFLAMHGANTFGNDKETFINKHKWVLENEEKIIESAKNPLGESAFWKESTEEPWAFLAFCFEWADYREYKENFKSHLCIAMDGSCNGLQHLSAMLFDEVGGKSVNLTNNSTKGDIYSDVKDITIKLLQNSTDPLAKKLLDFGITRKTVKRPVMIVPYAGTIRACNRYIHDDLISRGAESHFKEDYKAALNLCTNTVWEAISRAILKGREVMDYLKEVATVVTRETKSPEIVWTTPNGFKVIQKAVHQKSSELKVTPLGNHINMRVRSRMNIPTDKTNVRRHGTGIAPNFVHSLDACHLQNTVNSIDVDYGMIHDSFGTHANTSRLMYDAIRLEFYKLYKDGNVLSNFLMQQPDLEYPEPPSCGALDLQEVLKSEFFFS